MRIEIRPAKNGQFTWAFVAANGKQTANNEVFASRGNAIRAAKGVVRSVSKCVDRDGVDFTTARDGDKTVVTFA